MFHRLRQQYFGALLLGSLLAGISPGRAQLVLLAQGATQQRGNPSSPQSKQLKDVLNDLSRQYGVDILFAERIVDGIQVGSYATTTHQNIEQILNKLLKPHGLSYRKMKNGSLLIRGSRTNPNPPVSFSPQHPGIEIPLASLPGTGVIASPTLASASLSFPVQGRVTASDNGDGLPGVTITIKGTTQGTTTDGSGNFQLTVPGPDAVLVFSFVGYQALEQTVGNQRTFTVQLTPDTKSLNEVVVVGYSTQAKRDVTGSVSTVSAKDLQAVPANNVGQQLQGRVAGVTIGNDGQPGGNVMVRIRGIGSITGGNDPLYIIDGVPTQGGLNQINPNDVETLQVLKDASTASIYGARASNGVVIITTKKGKQGQSKITYDAFYGVQTPTKSPEMLNTQQYADVVWQNYRNIGNVSPTTGNPVDATFGDGAQPRIPDYLLLQGGAMEGDPRVAPANYTNNPKDPQYGISKFMFAQANKTGTDWWNTVMQTAPMQSHNLSVTGGNAQNRYAISGSYYAQDGIVKFTSFKRYSLRANTEFTIKKNIRVGENLQFAYTDQVAGLIRDENSAVLAYQMPPFMPIYDVGGNFAGGRSWVDHPYTRLYRNRDNHGYTSRVFGNVYAEVDLIKDLTLRTSLGVDNSNWNLSNFAPAAPESFLLAQNAQLQVSSNYNLNITWTNTLAYKKRLGDFHNLSAFVGTEAVRNKYRDFSTSKANFAFENPDFQYLNAGSTVLSSSGSGSDTRLFSVFGKVDYAFKERFLLSATLRRDASSRFAPTYRWGTFPAFSAGWRLSEESFLKGVSFIDDLKLRAGWGQTGNQEINPYNQYTTYGSNLNSSSYPINGANTTVVPGFEVAAQGNPTAQWEAQTMTNLGLDVTLFKGKLDVTLDAYNRQSSKLLLEIPSPATDGQNRRPAVNIGGIRNRGFDALVNYHGSAVNNELKFDIGLNWSTYRNVVTDLYGGPESFITGFATRQPSVTRTKVGHPISSFYGFVIDGIFQSQEEADAHPTQGGDRALYNKPGRFKFRDVNGDGAIDDSDQTFIGSPHPKFTYGLNLSAQYKGFDLALFFQGVSGNDLYNYQKWRTDFQNFTGNRSVRILDSWTPENRDAVLPQINSLAAGYESQASTYFIEKGSYLRGKNLQIGYTLPTTLVNKVKVDRLRVYVQGTNFFTSTNYSGLDPEVNLANYGGGADRDIGVDRGVYPLARTFTVGLSLTF
ncbi:TonB-linked SusC/RagA family outer membrane protein [Larkinella arboricola]|uniref:TonB-linked SusC/RagA family outer membrane protein n=1 Tax=Larkinella arboricola TaxID=643671 RepID=A0A327WMP7_LARAB|nr:SusC/RagA family TonB-linked outer membrane protein [Larkinella arboricola]RAJ93219.1 TonB-linked SusC/RagA family outer membrane protein [Larkinella arboricola]